MVAVGAMLRAAIGDGVAERQEPERGRRRGDRCRAWRRHYFCWAVPRDDHTTQQGRQRPYHRASQRPTRR
eukprot:1888125-Prymnesium_polylepis.1